MKKFLFTLLCTLAATVAAAQSLTVIANESRIFDQPNVKSYATTNMAGADVLLQPGMVFKVVGTPTDGWMKIEYTPGLNAFLLASQTAGASQLGTPQPGTYTLTNDASAKLQIAHTDKWTANDGKTEYVGTEICGAVIFTDKFGNTVYSLAVVGGKPLVYSYNNDLTKFL